jgi:hypothetical protein
MGNGDIGASCRRGRWWRAQRAHLQDAFKVDWTGRWPARKLVGKWAAWVLDLGIGRVGRQGSRDVASRGALTRAETWRCSLELGDAIRTSCAVGLALMLVRDALAFECARCRHAGDARGGKWILCSHCRGTRSHVAMEIARVAGLKQCWRWNRLASRPGQVMPGCTVALG